MCLTPERAKEPEEPDDDDEDDESDRRRRESKGVEYGDGGVYAGEAGESG